MRLDKEIAKYYYTAAQARKVLGLDEQALQYWVRKERLHKTVLPGRSQGLYLRKEVDGIAEQIEATIIAQNAEGLNFRRATVDDLEKEYRLARIIFGRRADTPEIQQGKRAFLERNPDIDYHLYDEGNLVGCIHIIPLKHEAIMEFLEGNVIAWLIDPDNIEQFGPGKPIECLFLDTLTDPGVEPIKRSAYAAYMIAKLVRRLTEMGSQGVEITKAYGASRTPSGIRILKSGGFQVIKERDNGAVTFELDIMNSKEKILRGYQNAFQEWKTNQKMGQKAGITPKED
jgi:hypothetical protein